MYDMYNMYIKGVIWTGSEGKIVLSDPDMTRCLQEIFANVFVRIKACSKIT